MSEKILSIIVPSYNMEKYLPKCLGSLVIAPELMEKLEVLVVNDGSKDRTSEIAHEFAAKWPGSFLVIDKENGNYGSCFNAALKIASGRFVKSLDADDSYDAVEFEKYMRFLDAIPEVGGPDVVFNDFVDVSPEDVVIGGHSYSFVGHKSFTFADFCKEGMPDVWHCAIAYRRTLLVEIKYEQSEGVFYTDQQWDMIPMLYARAVAYCSCVLYRYLIGRAEQSCDSRVRLKNFSMHIPMEKKIIEAYVANFSIAPRANIELVERQILQHARCLYYNYLILNNKSLCQRDIIDFDNYIKVVCPSLYAKIGLISCCGFIRFRYIKEWRRKYTVRTMKFFVCRVIKFIVAKGW